jgi:hypothetical protein
LGFFFFCFFSPHPFMFVLGYSICDLVNARRMNSIRWKVGKACLLAIIAMVCVSSFFTLVQASKDIADLMSENIDCKDRRRLVSERRMEKRDGLFEIADEEVVGYLKEFWNATGGPYWTEYRWNFEGEWYCWPGIEVEEDGSISMFMFANNITGEFPETFGRIPISYVGLQSNRLTGTIPNSFCNSSTFGTLSLSSNRLEGTIPECLGYGPAEISSISLAQNALNGSIPDSIYSLEGLLFLVLNGNNLSGTISPLIGNLKSLQSLDLSNNQLSGSLPLTMSNMSLLSQLLLGHNQFSGILSKDLLKALGSNLSKFVITGNQFEGPISSITYLRNATVVNASNNRFTAPLMNIRFMGKIAYLDISYNQIIGTLNPKDLIMFTVSDLAYYNTIGNEISATSQNDLEAFPFTYAGSTQSKTSTANWTCQTISIRETGLTFMVDPSFIHYKHCSCIRGFFGSPPDHCFSCPANADHCKNGNQLEIPPGKYPYPVLAEKPQTTISFQSRLQHNPPSESLSTSFNNHQHININTINSSIHQSKSKKEEEAEDNKSPSIFSFKFWSLSRMEALMDEEDEIEMSSKKSSSSSSSSTSTSPLKQPVFFEECPFNGACSFQCSIEIWVGNDGAYAAYMKAPPGVTGDECHCNRGFSGRKCSKCVCDANPDHNNCYYHTARTCQRCKTVWSTMKSTVLLLIILGLLLGSLTFTHLLIFRSKRIMRDPHTSHMLGKSLLMRIFIRILHVRTIGYFKVFLIWVQTLAALVDWPTAALQKMWALLEITNGNAVGIGATCLWTALRVPTVTYLTESLLPIALILILALSILLAHLIWRLFIRTKASSYNLLSSTIITDSEEGGGDEIFDAESVNIWQKNERDAHSSNDHLSIHSDDSHDDDDDNQLADSKLFKKDFAQLPPLENDIQLSTSGGGGVINGGGGGGGGGGVRYFSARGLLVSEMLAVSYFFYFGVTFSALSWFTCETQVGTNLLYLQERHWMRCDGNAVKETRLLTIPFLIIYTAGVPALFATLLFYYRNLIHLRVVNDVIGGLYRCYRKKLFWWELVILARRLGLAFVLRIAKDSAFHIWSIYSVLSISVALQFLFQPFNQIGENRVEELSLLLLILTFAAQEAAQTSERHNLAIFWLSVALNATFTLITLSLLIRSWWTSPVKMDDDED